jgi:hypothetical protein
VLLVGGGRAGAQIPRVMMAKSTMMNRAKMPTYLRTCVSVAESMRVKQCPTLIIESTHAITATAAIESP